MTVNNKAYYSISEFAKELGVHRNTIRNGIKFGRIAGFKVGTGRKSMYRIAQSELQRMALMDLKNVMNEIKDLT